MTKINVLRHEGVMFRYRAIVVRLRQLMDPQGYRVSQDNSVYHKETNRNWRVLKKSKIGMGETGAGPLKDINGYWPVDDNVRKNLVKEERRI